MLSLGHYARIISLLQGTNLLNNKTLNVNANDWFGLKDHPMCVARRKGVECECGVMKISDKMCNSLHICHKKRIFVQILHTCIMKTN